MARISVLRGSDRKANIITFLLGGLVSSELMWIINTDNKRTDFERKVNAQISVTEGVISRLKNGEVVDVNKELLMVDDKDESVDAILSSLEAMDNKWATETPTLSGSGPKRAVDSGSGKWI